MGLNHFRRLVASRWPILLLAAVAGMLGGYLLVTSMNQSQEPVVQSVAPVVFVPEPDAKMDDRLQAAHQLAQEVNQDELQAHSGSVDIVISPVGDRLLFVASDVSQSAAEETATTMRDNFLQAASPAGDDQLVQDALQRLQAQIKVVDDQLSQLNDQGNSDAEKQFLDAQIAALGNHVGDLVLELAGLEQTGQGSSQRAREIRDELDSLRSMLSGLEDDMTALTESSGLSTEDELARVTLQRQYDELVNRYEALYIESTNLDPFLVAADVETADVTPSPRSVALGALIGLLGGLLAGLGVLWARDRVIRPVLGVEDLPDTLVLGEFPPRWPAEAGGHERLWYVGARPTPRRSGIQVLRATVEGSQDSGSSVVAVTGTDGDPRQAQALAGDVAASLAVAGRSVILIDANLDRPSQLSEFASDGLTVSDVLIPSVDEEEALSLVKQAVNDRPYRYPELRVIPAGAGVDDMADSLASRRFTQLLAEAAATADVVIVAGPEAAHPGTDSLSQRVNAFIVITEVGEITRPILDPLLRELGGRRAHLLGIVLLSGDPEDRPSRWAMSRERKGSGGSRSRTGRHRRRLFGRTRTHG